MGGKAPSERLQQLWLDAVLLPGIEDPRESCLTELAEYTQRPRAELLELCQGQRERLKQIWSQHPRDTAKSIDTFYRNVGEYVYGLLWWHCLQRGPAVAWNARILELAQQHGVRSCLDFGGGIGSNAFLFQKAGIETTLAEISQPSLEFARWRAERRGLKIRLVDLEAEPLRGEQFDLVTAIDVLEHVPDALATLRRLASLVRPGGFLCFDLIAGKYDPDEPFHLLRSKYPIRSRLRSLGFRRVEGFGKYLFLQRVERSSAASRALLAWDVLRWRLYYLAQGQWPALR